MVDRRSSEENQPKMHADQELWRGRTGVFGLLLLLRSFFLCAFVARKPDDPGHRSEDKLHDYADYRH